MKYFFLFLHIVFALDLGYIKCRTFRPLFITTILALIPCFVLSLILYKVFVENISLEHWPSALYKSIQYVFSVVIFAFTDGNNSFCQLLKSLYLIDSKIHVKKKNYDSVNIILVCICLIIPVYIYLHAYNYCFLFELPCLEDSVVLFLVLLQTASFHNILAINYLIFYFSYRRMRALLNTFANSDSNELYYLNVYKDIVDAVEKAKKSYDYFYSIALMVQVPLLVCDLYDGLVKVKNFQIKGVLEYALVCIPLLDPLIFLSLPTVSADLLTTTAHKLEEIIQNRILQERRESHKSHLELFKMYVSARPMRFNLFELIPLDWTLPVTIINVCIAYQIILVQLTHLY